MQLKLLPKMLREAGIASQDQAEKLADLIAEELDRDYPSSLPGGVDLIRSTIET